MQIMACFICDRIEMIKKNENRYCVGEFETGYVVLGDHQFFKGYSLFLSKIHARELHDLDADFRKKFLWEMSEAAAAVYRAFRPKKLNYELLGNTDEHLHWHIFPRHSDDPQLTKPIWTLPKDLRESQTPSDEELIVLKTMIAEELEKSLGFSPRD